MKKYWVGRGSDNLFRRQKASSVQLNQADLVQSSQWKNLLMISPYFYHVRIRISCGCSSPQQFGCVVKWLMIPLDVGAFRNPVVRQFYHYVNWRLSRVSRLLAQVADVGLSSDTIAEIDISINTTYLYHRS